MKKVIFLFIFLLITLHNIYPQTSKKNSFADAEAYFIDEKYSLALPVYLDLIKNDPSNFNLFYRAGLCYLYNTENREVRNAITFFTYAAQAKTTKKYNEGSIVEKRAPNDLYYYLGKAYSLEYNFDSAIISFTKYKDLLSSKETILNDMIDRQIITVYNAREIIKMTSKYELVDFEEYINFPYFIKDYPILSQDGKTIIFVSPQGKGSKSASKTSVFYSRFNDTLWSKPKDISVDIKAYNNTIPVSISADGKTLFLVRDDNDDGNVYSSSFKNGNWLPGEKLNVNINTKSWESYASISADGKTLYFSSARPGGVGGLDIYKSELNDKGEWGTALNLGPSINTKYDEDMPSISEDNKTLYYSSEGNYSMGGYDIFVTSDLGAKNWSVPQNLGSPVNTVEDDIFSLIKYKGNSLFFPVEKFQSVFAKRNAFKIIETGPAIDTGQVVVHGSITLQDKMNELPKDFRILVIDSLNSETLYSIVPDLTSGKYKQNIPNGNFKLKFTGTGYNPKIEHIIISKDNIHKSIVVNAEMVSSEVSSGKYFTIKNLFFDFGKSTIRKDAEIELEKFIRLMKDYPSLQVEIIGYTDSKGSLKLNKMLSENRAKEVSEYLINNDIENYRVRTKGIALDNYIAINENPDGTDNPEGRQFNRRVEIKIIKNNENIVINNEVTVPENFRSSRFSKNDRFKVLLAKQKTKISKIKNIIFTENLFGDEYIYTSGDFEKKSEAIGLLNQVIGMGFSDARIITESEFNSFSRISIKKTFSTLNDSTNFYTIQLCALSNPANEKLFKNLKNVVERSFPNGIYKYTYGTFISFSKAKEGIKSLPAKTFPDAFIIKLSSFHK